MERFVKKNITLDNGEKYAYIEQGTGEKVFLLLHGNMSSSVYFYELLARIPNNIRVLAPDLRGFGDSSYNSRFNSLDELADDVLNFVDKLKVREAYVLGWSTGAGVAYKIAAKKPTLVKKIISLAGASYRGYPIFKKGDNNMPLIGQIYASKEEMAKDPVQVAPALHATATQNKAFYDYIYSLTIYNVRKPGPVLLSYFLDETLKQRNLVDIDWSLANLNMSNYSNLYNNGTGDIAKVTCPVLLLWGDKDLVVLEYMVNETLAALKNATKRVYQGVSHTAITDIPDQFAADVLDFFQ